MKIELHGIIQNRDKGHRHTMLVVLVAGKTPYEQPWLEVDIEVSRDMILNFLSEKYGVQRGDIVWPGHIQVPDVESEKPRPL